MEREVWRHPDHPHPEDTEAKWVEPVGVLMFVLASGCGAFALIGLIAWSPWSFAFLGGAVVFGGALGIGCLRYDNRATESDKHAVRMSDLSRRGADRMQRVDQIVSRIQAMAHRHEELAAARDLSVVQYETACAIRTLAKLDRAVGLAEYARNSSLADQLRVRRDSLVAGLDAEYEELMALERDTTAVAAELALLDPEIASLVLDCGQRDIGEALRAVRERVSALRAALTDLNRLSIGEST